jgi:trigger factor
MLIPGFEEQLVGAKVGEKREVNVSFPVDYPRKELAGRPAVFEVTVKELRHLVPAALDDELARGLGLEDLGQLRQRLREQFEAEYASASRSQVKRQLLDKLAESHDFEMPPGLVDAEFQAIWSQIEADHKKGLIDPEDKGKSEEELKSEYRAIAARRVKLGLLLSEVGRRAQVEVKQDELNRAVMNDARRYPGQERRVVEYYQNHPEALAQLRAPLYEDKVVDYILETAKVAERKVSPKEFAAELNDSNAPEGAA